MICADYTITFSLQQEQELLPNAAITDKNFLNIDIDRN